MTLRVEIFARGLGKTSEPERATILRWEKELFAKDKDIIDAFVWENKRGLGFSIQTYLDDALVGVAHVFVRLMRMNGSMVLAGCLGGVMTAKARQGAGIGSTTVRSAADTIFGNFRADVGVLLCTTALVPFYQPLGWRTVQCPVMIEQPAGRIRWPQETMILLKATDDSMPEELDLCGLPF